MGQRYEQFAKLLREARESRPKATRAQEWVARELTRRHRSGEPPRVPRPISRSLLGRWERPGGEDMPPPPIDRGLVDALAAVYGADATELYDAAVRAWLEHNGAEAVAAHLDAKAATVAAELASVRAHYEVEHRDHELRSGLRPTERELVWTVRRIADRYPGATNAILMLVRLLFPAASGDVPGAVDPGADVLGSVVLAVRTTGRAELIGVLASVARLAHPATIAPGIVLPGLLESAPKVGPLKLIGGDDALRSAALDVLMSRPGDSENHDRLAIAVDEDGRIPRLRADPAARLAEARRIALERPTDPVEAFRWHTAYANPVARAALLRNVLASGKPSTVALLLEDPAACEVLAGPPVVLTPEQLAELLGS